MDEMDELRLCLQTGIAELYHYANRAEAICSDENANYHDRVIINDAWLKLENAILQVETLAYKVISQKTVAKEQSARRTCTRQAR
ncbi:hypothetical protein [Sporomusa sphaeroides]|uniref:hypothetical protein n=1 Tax=Sporomusa sphaeroides TaxID=47679 RepID=UPI002CD4B660|nr:hypothetical protein [Sporomusa sphaeroides]HML35212.1 hypothetical protein [Sporomusa sphaeroides]